jgi:hypothetical protein
VGPICHPLCRLPLAPGRSGRRRTVALLPSIKGLCLDPAGLKRCRRLCPVGTHRRDAVLLRCRPPRLTPLLRSWVHVAEDDRAATPDRASRRRSPVLDEEAAATPPFLLAGEPLPALSCPPFTASAHPPLFTCAARRNPRRPGVRRRRTKPTSSSTSARAPVRTVVVPPVPERPPLEFLAAAGAPPPSAAAVAARAPAESARSRRSLGRMQRWPAWAAPCRAVGRCLK